MKLFKSIFVPLMLTGCLSAAQVDACVSSADAALWDAAKACHEKGATYEGCVLPAEKEHDAAYTRCLQ